MKASVLRVFFGLFLFWGFSAYALDPQPQSLQPQPQEDKVQKAAWAVAKVGMGAGCLVVSGFGVCFAVTSNVMEQHALKMLAIILSTAAGGVTLIKSGANDLVSATRP